MKNMRYIETIILAIFVSISLCSCGNSSVEHDLPEIVPPISDNGSETGQAQIAAGKITHDVPFWATAVQSHCERYTGLNLDGIGTNDDELYISVYSWDDHLNADAIVLCVLFGTGNSVAHVIPAVDYSFSWGYELHLGKLFSEQRNAVVIEVPIPQSNYRAADLFVLDIVNPQDEYPVVIERMNTQQNQIRLPNGMITDMTSLFTYAEPEFVCGSEVVEAPGASISGLKVCLLGDSEQTLMWANGGWNISEYHNTSTPEFFNDIGKPLSELKNEYSEGEFFASLDGFPDSAAACFGEQGAKYVYFFFGGHDGDFEKAMGECEEQIKCAGFITTANILFPDMEDDMSFEDFFSLIGVDDYEYLLGEEVTTGEGWLRFTYNGMEVMVNTNEVTAGGGWAFTGAEIVKRNAPVSIVDPEILNTNQDLAEAVMFD